MVSRVFSLLATDGPGDFSAFVARVPERQDRALAFLALLTLIRRQAVEASQPVLFGEITFTHYGASQTPVTSPDAKVREDER
jgi:chromatin segregation and condensation protein Rec8/ScpA/Scc1 (kleisin family)